MTLKFVFLLSFLLVLRWDAPAQTKELSDAAYKIAKRMKDTLSLSENQLQSLFDINMKLQLKKLSVPQQPGAGNQIQAIENTRDSLYRTVLSENVYQIYRQKKQQLITSN